MIRHVHGVRPSVARGLAADVYGQVSRDFGAVVPPMRLHSPAPELLAGVWSACREALVAGEVSRAVKETVAAVVSDINRCPWCVDAHATMLRAGGHGAAADQIGRSGLAAPDHGLDRVAAWAAATRSPGSPALLSPPFEGREAPEVIGTAVVFHYINRLVTILLPEHLLPSSGPARVPAARAASLWFSRAVRRTKQPGDSLRLLPEAPLPAGLSWASSSPAVAGAFARWASVVEEAGQAVFDPAIRTVVRSHVDAWTGDDPGLSRAWVEEAIGELTGTERPAARLALLTALAPHQVDDGIIKDFRSAWPRDVQLISALAWSSLAAARRVGSWLGELVFR